jgi:DNA-binding transcriptional MocR family regulator
LLELLAAGRWRKHVERLQQKIGKARTVAAKQLREAGVMLEPPGEGGLFLWGAVPPQVDVEELVRDAYRNKIVLMRGSAFMADGADDPHIRFNVVYSQHTRLADYLRPRLAAVATAQDALRRARAHG